MEKLDWLSGNTGAQPVLPPTLHGAWVTPPSFPPCWLCPTVIQVEVGQHTSMALGATCGWQWQQKDQQGAPRPDLALSSLSEAQSSGRCPHCQLNTWAILGLESWVLLFQGGSGLWPPPSPLPCLMGFAGGERKHWGLAAAGYL